MSKLQKTIDKASNALEDQRVNPVIIAITQTLALIPYFSFKLQWFLSEIIFGKDACTIARNKLNSEFKNKK